MLKLSAREQWEMRRALCRTDLYWLLWQELNRADIENEWLLTRCREVQAAPDGYLDLWSREHYKSTIITFAQTIQTILCDPEVTVGIFSHTRPIAKGFLRQIRRELEQNETLKDLFPEVLWSNPDKDAPKWSEDDGLIVKRNGNPKESTVEAWGLVDGQPTSKHFSLLVYDDVVTQGSVTTPEMIAKTTDAVALSLNLGANGGRRRWIGTRYHANDTYGTLIRRGTVMPRIHAATDDGTFEGAPVLWDADTLARKRRDMGPYVAACQLMQNPMVDTAHGFKREWLRTYSDRTAGGMNVYVLVDPASEKKKGSDRTAMAVIGLGQDQNYYLLDLVYDRLNLTERTRELFKLHRRWKPLAVGYEKYGQQADIEHIRYVQERENYRFEIVPLGGQMSKPDRIKRMIPALEQGRWYIPGPVHRVNYEGQSVDVIEQWLCEEYDNFPVAAHDDALDAMSRIFDETLAVAWPQSEPDEPDRYRKRSRAGSAWAA